MNLFNENKNKHCKDNCLCEVVKCLVNDCSSSTGPTGNCSCSCVSRGELVVNGGMEIVIDDKPTRWLFTNPDDIISKNSQGRVHSGIWSANMGDASTLSQTINNIEAGCFYELRFFARGEGAQVSLNANVIFITNSGNVLGGNIIVRSQDMTNSNRDFAYYRLITTQAPSWNYCN